MRPYFGDPFILTSQVEFGPAPYPALYSSTETVPDCVFGASRTWVMINVMI